MCQMWQEIRYGVRWNPSEKLALGIRSLGLQKVKSIDISMDPLYEGTPNQRTFWHAVMTPRVRMTNPTLKVKTNLTNDRRAPSFVATIDGGKKLRFETDKMPPADLISTFNRLLGNPEAGKAGTRPRINI
ncbi:hypothetical protein PENTCL1PPCAC_8881 [Pristionchus entomophagus]|uniref:Ribosomal protein/NADH dehydrogenase domain-containing protein n=1 Tax=Pristionchus entomophagus TaxID=358040 RepID=A0AAV5T4V7_9BILA|nr:hypothetical protein PENTCL1PPCAC_8881 [Pristionchus entomophagus]